MASRTKSGKHDFDQLPSELKKEVIDYIDFLQQKYAKKKKPKKMKFDWAGSLSELKETYSSVELQHQMLDWR